jgi:Zn-dependent protease
MLGCRQCGTEIVPQMLSCPACGALRHADELKRLAASASAAAAAPSEALALWRQAMTLLPSGAPQISVIATRIEALSRQVEKGASRAAGSGKWKGVVAGGGALIFLLAKFKTVIFLLLGQGKLILLGLTKMGTLLSMFATFGVYWRIYGWKFAGGLILSIYIHEMGHVFVLRRLGFAASAPMFIPGFGAFIRLSQQYMTPREDARIGLAGPIWGLAAAVFAALLGFAFDSPACLVIAQWGAWINLFNLTPVWSLDGARGFHALRRRERIIATLVFAAAWLPANPGIALLALGAGIYGITRRNEPAESDARAFVEYLALCLALMAFSWLPVPKPPGP